MTNYSYTYYTYLTNYHGNYKFLPCDSVRVEPPLIHLAKEEKDTKDKYLININIKQDPNDSAIETYEFKTGSFEFGSPAE